jgi:hypothetical protein
MWCGMRTFSRRSRRRPRSEPGEVSSASWGAPATLAPPARRTPIATTCAARGVGQLAAGRPGPLHARSAARGRIPRGSAGSGGRGTLAGRMDGSERSKRAATCGSFPRCYSISSLIPPANRAIVGQSCRRRKIALRQGDLRRQGVQHASVEETGAAAQRRPARPSRSAPPSPVDDVRGGYCTVKMGGGGGSRTIQCVCVCVFFWGGCCPTSRSSPPSRRASPA